MKEFKVIIAGGRKFSDYKLLKQRCDNFLATKMRTYEVLIVSGTAKGADQLGERYAKERGLEVISFPADWDNNGNAAGHIRNRQMGDYADCLIAFWDGKSSGTKGMISYMKSLNKPYRVVDYV